MPPYAEVIGDPIAHSKSPAIHGFWLRALGLPWAYRATRVAPDALAPFLAARRADPDWRGCSVTAPLKELIAPLLDEVAAEARAIGAVNCVRREQDRLVGLNTDVDGIAEALAGTSLRGRRAAIIGGGGGARAAVHHLAERGVEEIVILVRNPAKAAGLARLAGPLTRIQAKPFDAAAEAIGGAALVINASPLGMAHADLAPAQALAALPHATPGFVAFDMVYDPVETSFLRAAAAAGGTPVDGLKMLVGQARQA
ncbi:MAG: shikimate dehydrogenase family protein, partial [Allosphingosinicella sp.]